MTISEVRELVVKVSTDLMFDIQRWSLDYTINTNVFEFPSRHSIILRISVFHKPTCSSIIREIEITLELLESSQIDIRTLIGMYVEKVIKELAHYVESRDPHNDNTLPEVAYDNCVKNWEKLTQLITQRNYVDEGKK